MTDRITATECASIDAASGFVVTIRLANLRA